VGKEIEGEDLEGEGVITGIGSSSTTTNFSRILSSNSNPFKRIKVHIHSFLHSLMVLLLVGCLLPGLSKVPTLSLLHSNLGTNPTNRLPQAMKSSHKILRAMRGRV
jgi:hypothetical protein